MLVRCKKIGGNGVRAACAAMTLVEVLVSVVVLALVIGGVLNGYVQANRISEWSSLSLAAQSLAQRGLAPRLVIAEQKKPSEVFAF